MGKHKPIWDPSTDCGDYVVAVGCRDIHTTGKKRYQKKYYTHTTRPGSLKSMTMDKMFEKWGGGEVLRRAVRGMLPKNRLRDKRLDRLKSEFLFLHFLKELARFNWLIVFDITAFEGLAHPYKKNIIKINGKSVIGKLPEVQAAFKEEKPVVESPAPTAN